MKSMTCGGAPTVFSLKSRRNLLRRAPVGGWYGCIRSTAGRGISAFWADSGLTSITDLVDRTNLHGVCVRLQTFGSGERCDDRSNLAEPVARKLLNRDHLHKIGYR